jgi:SAM-dependent methyltransferase
MKLKHDIEHDLEHTIPPEGGLDSQWLFRAMTERSLAWMEPGPGRCVVDLASGMGQDTLSLARRAATTQGANGHFSSSVRPLPGLVIGVEPSNRMIRFGQHVLAKQQPGDPPLPDALKFVRGLGEEIPLRSDSVDAVLCKGALDHFMDPALTVAEIARVLRPGARVVIALANYDSLSCRLGRWLDRGRSAEEIGPHPFYEPPPDHLTRFTHESIVALARFPLRVSRVEGLSLLWGFPLWGKLLGTLPKPLQRALLAVAYAIARWRPAWADVVILVAEKGSVAENSVSPPGGI